MIVIFAAEIDLGRYIAVYQRVNRDVKRNEIIAHLDWPSTDLSTINPNETLFISAHGSVQGIESLSSDQLAVKLVSKGLTDKIALKKIKLMVCSSGVSKNSTVPFCQRLADSLEKKGGPKTVVVIGFDGEAAMTDDRGSQHGMQVKQGDLPNWNDFQTKHMANFNKWNTIAKKMPCTSHEEFMKNATALYTEPEVFEAFQWLYTEKKPYYVQKGQDKVYANKTASGKTKTDFLTKI